MDDYYELLGVSPEADSNQIRNAYEAKRQLYTAILASSDPERQREAAQGLAALKVAYKVLGDRKKRGEYDEQYRNLRAKEEAATLEAERVAVQEAVRKKAEALTAEAEARAEAAKAIEAKRIAWAEERARQAVAEEEARKKAAAEIRAALAAEAKAKEEAARVIKARQAALAAERAKQEEARRQETAAVQERLRLEAMAREEQLRREAAAREEQLRQEAAAREEQLRQEAAFKEALLQEERKKAELEAQLRQQAEANAKLQASMGSAGQASGKKGIYLIGGGLLIAALLGFFLFSSDDKKGDTPSAKEAGSVETVAGGRSQAIAGGTSSSGSNGAAAPQQEKKAANTAVAARRMAEEFYMPLLRMHARHNREYVAWRENDYNRVQWENKQHGGSSYKTTGLNNLVASKDRFATRTDQGGYIQEVTAKRNGLQGFVSNLRQNYTYDSRLEGLWRSLFEVFNAEENYYHRIAAGETTPEILWDKTALALAKFDQALQECTSGAEAFGQLTPAKYQQLRVGMDYFTITRILQSEGHESNVNLRSSKEQTCDMVYQSAGRQVYVQFVNYQAIGISKAGF